MEERKEGLAGQLQMQQTKRIVANRSSTIKEANSIELQPIDLNMRVPEIDSSYLTAIDLGMSIEIID